MDYVFSLTTHLIRVHGTTSAEAQKMAAKERARKLRSKGGRRMFVCPCGSIVVKKSQHLSSGKHPELEGLEPTSPAFQTAFRAMKKVFYVVTKIKFDL